MRARTVVLLCAVSVACKPGAPSRAPATNGAAVARSLSQLEGCLLGGGAGVTDAAAMRSRARRMALGSGGAWPNDCREPLQSLRREAAAAHIDGASIAALEASLSGAPAHVAAFVEGREDGDAAVGWTPELLSVHQAFSRWLTARSVSVAAPVAGARAALATITQDVAPMPLGDGSARVGSSSAGGTLSVLFRDEGASVMCRTRDRGATLRCRRWADDDARGAVRAIVAHDRAEALGVFERAGAFRIEAFDVPDITVFALPGAPVAMRVSSDVLYAAVRTPRGDRLLRALRIHDAMELPTRLSFADGAAVLTGGNPSVHQAFARMTDHNAAVLGEQAFSALDARRSIAIDPATRLTTCQAEGVGYVAATDAQRTQVVMFNAALTERLGEVPLGGESVRVACDALGVTLWKGDSVASCTRDDDACGAPREVTGLMDLTRRDGEILGIAHGVNGALRVLRGRVGEALTRAAFADDAAHGGISANHAWLERVEAGAVLMTQGAVNAVLWSADGVAWHPAREAD